jgi:hypothetical protein
MALRDTAGYSFPVHFPECHLYLAPTSSASFLHCASVLSVPSVLPVQSHAGGGPESFNKQQQPTSADCLVSPDCVRSECAGGPRRDSNRPISGVGGALGFEHALNVDTVIGPTSLVELPRAVTGVLSVWVKAREAMMSRENQAAKRAM